MGDVNLDGIVSADDYVVLNANFNKGTGGSGPLASSALTAVPEPVSLAHFGLGAIAIFLRGRRSIRLCQK